MGYNNAVLGHPISTSFSQVDDWSTDLLVLERHSLVLELRYTNT